MKRLMALCITLLWLMIPFSAGATLVGSGDLKTVASWPTTSGLRPNYYTDYDGWLKNATFDYSFKNEDIFCVSEEDSANRKYESYDFYTITPDLNTLFEEGTYTKLMKVAWIGENWTNYGGGSDKNKGEAQKAAWVIMGMFDRDKLLGNRGNDWKIYNAARGITKYNTGNWFFAYNGTADDVGFQDFVTPGKPVPEPATMLMLGTGLFVLAGFSRRKFRKSRMHQDQETGTTRRIAPPWRPKDSESPPLSK